MKIYKSNYFKWQIPVITEKHSYELISKDSSLGSENITYIAFPWSQIVDLYQKEKLIEENLSIEDFVSTHLPKGLLSCDCVFTVCQTFNYKKLLPSLSKIGLDLVFVPHATKRNIAQIAQEFGVEILPYPLFPVNTSNSADTKSLLYSFIGNILYQGADIESRDRATRIRTKLMYDVNHPSNTIVFPIESWHFDSIVYKRDVFGKRLNAVEETRIKLRTIKYKEVLSKSRYALCPRGIGPASIRFWEALGAGAIPVNISDDFWLPGEEYFDWDSCVVNVKEADILDIPDILSHISEEQEIEMRRNALRAFKMFTGENFISPIKYKLLGQVPEID